MTGLVVNIADRRARILVLDAEIRGEQAVGRRRDVLKGRQRIEVSVVRGVGLDGHLLGRAVDQRPLVTDVG